MNAKLTHKEIKETIKELKQAVDSLWPSREDKTQIPYPIQKALYLIGTWEAKHGSGTDLTGMDICAAYVLCQAIHASLDTQLELRIQQKTNRNGDSLN